MHNKCGSLTAACFSLVLLSSVGSALTSMTDHRSASKATSIAQARLASRPHTDSEIVTGNGAIVNLKTMSESSAVRVGCGGSFAPVFIAQSLSLSSVLNGLGAFAVALISCACLPVRLRKIGYSLLNVFALCTVPLASMLLPSPLDSIVPIVTTLFAIGYGIYVVARSLKQSASLLIRTLQNRRGAKEVTADAVRKPVHPNYPNQRRSTAYVNSGCPKSADNTAERTAELASVR
jgi:hypothetical protein